MSITDVIGEYARSRGKELKIDLSLLPTTRGNFEKEFNEIYRVVEYARVKGWTPFEMHLSNDIASQISDAIPRHCRDIADVIGYGGNIVVEARALADLYYLKGTHFDKWKGHVKIITGKISFTVNRFVEHYFWDVLMQEMSRTYAEARSEREPLDAFEKATEPLALLIQAAKDREIQFHPIYRNFMDLLRAEANKKRMKIK